MSRYALWICCLVSLLAIAPAVRATGPPRSGGALLSVSVTSTTVHPGDFVSLSVSSVASWNGTRTNYSQGPVEITATTSAGGNYSPLAGLHELVNGTFGVGWVIGNDPINYVSVWVVDLQTGMGQRLEIDVSLSTAQAIDHLNKTLTAFEAGQQARDDQQHADEWFLVYTLCALIVGLSTAVVLAIENSVAHASSPPRESKWDRIKTWVRISRSPIPDVVDLAFHDPENLYNDVKLRAQIEILEHREQYAHEIEAQLRQVQKEIRDLPKTVTDLKARFERARKEKGLDLSWGVDT